MLENIFNPLGSNCRQIGSPTPQARLSSTPAAVNDPSSSTTSDIPLRVALQVLRLASKSFIKRLTTTVVPPAVAMDALTHALATNPSFTPLFKLLDDFEHYS